MTNKYTEFVPNSPMERQLFEAYSRIISGELENDKAISKVSKSKRPLKLNQVNVALEAGHSRTLISGDECEYPRIRDLILDQRPKVAAPITATEQLVKKSDLVSALKDQIKIRDSVTAAYVLRLNAVGKIAESAADNTSVRERSLEHNRIAESSRAQRSADAKNVLKFKKSGNREPQS